MWGTWKLRPGASVCATGSTSGCREARARSWASLGLATLAFVLVIARVVVGLVEAYPDPDNKSGFWDVARGNLMRTLDPGTMGGDTGWGFRVLMLTVTIGGLVIVASLIGIVSGAFDDKMVELRKGRSRVLETDHTIILGWNNQLFTDHLRALHRQLAPRAEARSWSSPITTRSRWRTRSARRFADTWHDARSSVAHGNPHCTARRRS